MRKNSKGRAEIKKSRMNFSSEKKEKKIFYPKLEKVISDDNEETYDINNEQKYLKVQKYKKERDEFSYNSLSTNKTEEIYKPHSAKKKKKEYPKDEKSIKRNYPKSKTQKKVPKHKKSIKREKSEDSKISNISEDEKNNKNESNVIKFLNPFYGVSDSDYNSEEYLENKQKRKRRKSRKSQKDKNNKEDIEMKDCTWNNYEFDSKKSILGKGYLPCREKEQKIIYEYIKEGLQTNGNYNSLYIAGMPGTGKTASVKTVINIIESEINKNKKYVKKAREIYLPTFTKLFICGTEFPTIANVYKTIYKFIFSDKKNISNKKCTTLLNKFFSCRNNYDILHLNDPSNSHIILVIDEIDFLINRDQKLLYNIFNWTTYEEAKLIVISISNTLDFPNRLLPKIKSRMGNNKLMFKPYNKDELIKIIKFKGIEYENFTQDAIKLSCMKVAAVNGDLRRIIQILTRAREIFNLESKKGKNKKIDKNYILRACEELFNSKLIKVIQSLQITEKIIICAILSKIKDVNDNKIKIGDLFDKKDTFISKYNESIGKNQIYILWEEYQKIIYNLVRIQLILFCEKNCSNFMENSISIKFYTDEFINACNEDMELKPVLDYLTSIIEV